MSRKLSFSTDDELNNSVKRYEQYLSGDASGYFDVEELIDIVEYYLRRGRTKDSSKALDLGFRLHPNNNELKVKRAKTLLAIGDNTGALHILSALSDKSDYETNFLTIETLVRLERNKEADILSNKILENEVGDLDLVCLEIAGVYMSQMKFDIALKWLLRGDGYNNKSIDLLFELAFCYEQELKYKEAIAVYNRIIDIDPYSNEAWFNIGQMYFNQQLFTKAYDAYNFALAIDENDVLSCLQKAHTLFQLDKFREAIEVYKEYEALTDDKWQVNLFIAECYENLEDYTQAIAHYSSSLEIYPDNHEALTGIGICLLEQEKYGESIKYFKEALTIQEELPSIWVYLAEALVGINDNDNALLSYVHALSLDPNQPETLFAAGNICLEKMEYEAALNYYLLAKNVDNTLDLINLFIAIAYFKMGETNQGMFHLEEAIILNAESKELFFDLCPEYIGLINI